MMNDIEKYFPHLLGEKQGTCTMYVLIFHSNDSMFLLLVSLPKQSPKRDMRVHSMPVSTRHCQNSKFHKRSSSNRLG